MQSSLKNSATATVTARRNGAGRAFHFGSVANCADHSPVKKKCLVRDITERMAGTDENVMARAPV